MIAMTEETIEDLDIDLEDEDEGTQTDNESDDLDSDELLEEVNRLKSQNAKLKAKKRKAIKTASKKAVVYDDFDKRYQAKKKQETFETDYPGVDYDVVQAIAERKEISMDDALGYLGTAGKNIIGREVTQGVKKTDDYLEKRKKAMGLA